MFFFLTLPLGSCVCFGNLRFFWRATLVVTVFPLTWLAGCTPAHAALAHARGPAVTLAPPTATASEPARGAMATSSHSRAMGSADECAPPAGKRQMTEDGAPLPGRSGRGPTEDGAPPPGEQHGIAGRCQTGSTPSPSTRDMGAANSHPGPTPPPDTGDWERERERRRWEAMTMPAPLRCPDTTDEL